MKFKFIKIALSIFTASWLLTSCLKDSGGIMDPSETNNVIEFANTGTPVKSPTATSSVSFTGDLGTLEIGDTSSFNVNISYSGADMAPNDITVKLEKVDSILSNYNDANGTSYELPPTSVVDYSTFFPNDVVIKKGTQKVQLKVPGKLTTDYDFSKEYALPLKITSTSNGIISGNYGTALYLISVRNSYDGNYSVVSGTVTRYTSPGIPANDALSGNMGGNPNMTLTTTSAYTVELGNLRWAGGGSGVAGIDNLRATVDPITNEVTLKSLGNATLSNIAGAVNKYDPETMTFTLNFIWNPTGAARIITNLVLKYNSAR